MSKTYFEKLKDPRWQRLSAIVKERAEWKCERCDSAEKQLSAHHKLYRAGAEPWEYEPHALESLCSDCHAELETQLATIRWLICGFTISELNRLRLRIAKQIIANKWEQIPPTKARMVELEKEIDLTFPNEKQTP